MHLFAVEGFAAASVCVLPGDLPRTSAGDGSPGLRAAGDLPRVEGLVRSRAGERPRTRADPILCGPGAWGLLGGMPLYQANKLTLLPENFSPLPCRAT